MIKLFLEPENISMYTRDVNWGDFLHEAFNYLAEVFQLIPETLGSADLEIFRS